MYEFASVAGAVGVIAFLAMLWKLPALRHLGAFILLPVVLLMFLAGTVLYSQAQPLVPALQSYWLAIHVTLVSIAEGALMTSAVLHRAVPGQAAPRPAWPRPPTTAGRGGQPGRAAAGRGRRSTRRPTGSSRSPSRSTRSRSSAARSGPRRRGDGTGAGTPRRPGRSSSGSSTPATCTPARRPAGRAAPPPGSTWLGFGAITFNFLVVNIVVSGLHSYAGLC